MDEVPEALEFLLANMKLTDADFKDPRAEHVDPVPGDHIVRKMPNTKFWHHAIFVGKDVGEANNMVVEMAGKDDPDKPIQTTRFIDFVEEGDGVFAVVKYSAAGLNSKDALQNSVWRARHLAEFSVKNPAAIKYQALGENCEVLAILCRSGTWVPALAARLRETLSRFTLPPRRPINKFSWTQVHGFKTGATTLFDSYCILFQNDGGGKRAEEFQEVD